MSSFAFQHKRELTFSDFFRHALIWRQRFRMFLLSFFRVLFENCACEQSEGRIKWLLLYRRTKKWALEVKNKAYTLHYPPNHEKSIFSLLNIPILSPTCGKTMRIDVRRFWK